MSKLHQLVREALDRRREERSGGFVHNAAATDLLDHGCDAVAAIESEVLALADKVHPRDLDSVMIIYARLIRELQLGDRCVAFIRRLPPHFRHSALGGVAAAWWLKDPQRPAGPGTLPESLRCYVEEVLSSGDDAERRIAEKILHDINHAA